MTHSKRVLKITTRRCNEPTIPAAQSQPAENSPGVSRRFIARFISILSLGLLGVAIPVQIQMMTHSTRQVGLSVTLTGASMFVGLMVGACWLTAMNVNA